MAEAWIIRTADYTSVVSTLPASEAPIGSLTRFEAYGAEIEEAEDLNMATTSDLFSVDGQPFKYGFIGLGSQNPGLVLAVRMRADYLVPLALLRERILWGVRGRRGNGDPAGPLPSQERGQAARASQPCGPADPTGPLERACGGGAPAAVESHGAHA